VSKYSEESRVPTLDPTGMMSFEDEDSKIRRNLMTASSAVILLWFFQVPLSRYVSSVLKNPDWTAPGWKVWLVVLAVLFYLALRYRFTDDHKALTEAVGDAYSQRLSVVAYGLVTTAIQDTRSVDTRHLGFDRSKIFQQFGEAATQKMGAPSRIRVINVRWDKQAEPTRGIVADQIRAELNDGRNMDGTLPIEYDLTGPKLWRCRIEAWFFSWIYSRESVVYLVPCLLAACATGITAYNLARALG
jgi:hypothetical protein